MSKHLDLYMFAYIYIKPPSSLFKFSSIIGWSTNLKLAALWMKNWDFLQISTNQLMEKMIFYLFFIF